MFGVLGLTRLVECVVTIRNCVLGATVEKKIILDGLGPRDLLAWIASIAGPGSSSRVIVSVGKVSVVSKVMLWTRVCTVLLRCRLLDYRCWGS